MSESTDRPLDEAVDSFLEWAEREEVGAQVQGLPAGSDIRQASPGSKLGEFHLVRRLGAGGMGVVFEARQSSAAGRRVAVKVLRNLFASKRLAERFRREIAAISALDHPGIVPIVAAGIEGDVPYYAMGFIEGRSGARILRDLRSEAGVPKTTESVRERLTAQAKGRSGAKTSLDESAWEVGYMRWCARLAAHLADALQHAHDRQIVHRDVKPANVIITPRGAPVLLDFGLADSDEEESLTKTGDFLGTLAYASPEQVRGGTVDGRTDVYSLGATLYELLSLRRPFDARNRTELSRCIEEEEPAPLGRWVPTDLRTICSCALAKDVARRYATAADMAHDLRQFLAARPIDARAPNAWARLLQAVRAHPRVFAAVILLPLLLNSAVARVKSHLGARGRVDAGSALLEETWEKQEALNALRARFVGRDDWRRAGDPLVHGPFESLRGELHELDRSVESGYRSAENELRSAFELVSGFAPARRRLAALFAAELEQALRTFDDVCRPQRVRALEARLKEFDDDALHSDLLEAEGQFSLTTEPTGSSVLVSNADGEEVLRTRTPIESLSLEEGSYIAQLEASGRCPVRYPFVVRRSSSPEDAGAPFDEHCVELLPSWMVGDDEVHVPEGWTLVSDDPPRWEFVDAFLMRRYELTQGEWVELLNRCEEVGVSEVVWNLSESRVELRPRDAYDPTNPETQCVVRSEDGRWQLAVGVDPKTPVYGLGRFEMERMASALNRMEPSTHDWYHSLPTQAEWVRAARGADARRYPWGNAFGWDETVGAFESDGSRRRGMEPVGTARNDVSPVGIHDLAGSVAEATLNTFGPLNGDFAFCGGSYRSSSSRQLTTTSVRLVRNEPELDGGFRFVRRRLPRGLVAKEGKPLPFRDDFERPDSSTVGNGWYECVNRPLAGRSDPAMVERCEIRAGALVCEGGIGNYSEASAAWRVIHPSPAGFDLVSTMSATSHSFDQFRGFGVTLYERVDTVEGRIQVSIGNDWRLTLHAGGHTAQAASRVDASARVRIVLSVDETTASVQVVPLNEESPSVEVSVSADEPLPLPRYIVFEGTNYIGGRIRVEDVEFVPR